MDRRDPTDPLDSALDALGFPTDFRTSARVLACACASAVLFVHNGVQAGDAELALWCPGCQSLNALTLSRWNHERLQAVAEGGPE
jgi:hypothetical protein